MGKKRMVKSSSVVICFPWPPSVNHYWRRCGDRYFVSQTGKQYRKLVMDLCLINKSKGHFAESSRLSVSIKAYPPDKRRRDLDNVLKSLLDSLQHAGVYNDDNQIDQLSITRESPNKGVVWVTIKEITMEQCHPQTLHSEQVVEQTVDEVDAL